VVAILQSWGKTRPGCVPNETQPGDDSVPRAARQELSLSPTLTIALTDDYVAGGECCMI